MTLASSSFSNGELTLNFTNAEAIEAGKAYLIKWEDSNSSKVTNNYNQGSVTNSGDVENPLFTGVIIENAAPADQRTLSQDDYVDFIGTFNPVTTGDASDTGDNTKLYLGADDNLYYPSEAITIRSFHAYFQLKNGLTAAALNNGANIRLNFEGGESTGVKELKNSRIEELKSENGWYDLQGRKLNGKPTHPGIYLQGTRKVMIK